MMTILFGTTMPRNMGLGLVFRGQPICSGRGGHPQAHPVVSSWIQWSLHFFDSIMCIVELITVYRESHL